MTVDERIARLAEYWCYHKPRESEMALEIKTEILRIAKESFVAGMEFNRNYFNPDFEDFWLALLTTELEW